MAQISFQNLIAGATVTASTSAAGFPASHLKEPEHLGLAWRSTVITETTIVIDLGAPATVNRIALIGHNIPILRIQQHTADSWGAPTYDSGPIGPGELSNQLFFRRWVEKAGGLPFTLRYTRILIPAQTPLGASYFMIQGIWMGAFTALPRGGSAGYIVGRPMPRHTATSRLGGWTKSVTTGDPFTLIRWRRQAVKDPQDPGGGLSPGVPGAYVADEWTAWRRIDRQIEAAAKGGLCCYIEDHWGPGAVWCVRQQNQTSWTDEGLRVARDEWELAEAVAG